jgi:hypothetical protein
MGCFGPSKTFNWRNPRSIREEFRFLWYILSCQYRTSNISQIRMFGNIELACLLAAWIITLCLIIFGDLSALQFDWRFA